MNQSIEFTVTKEPTDLPPPTDVVDWNADHRFTLGDLGSLAEMMGVDEAEAYLEEHSLTRIARRGVIRRQNERFRKYGV